MCAKILVYGDIHLSSKKYGAHRNYPIESLNYFKNITKTAEEFGATHIIGLGDLTYGRFGTLEYRKAVEDELIKQNEICKGNRFELKGNHDEATYGMTEYEYYIQKGLLKPSNNLEIDKLRLSMIDYGKCENTEILPVDSSYTNIILMHDFFKFSNTALADYGKAITLDNFNKWFGVDYIIGGHIHNHEIFDGNIKNLDGTMGKSTTVTYLGCPCRPAYRKGFMQDTGQYAFIETSSDDVKVSIHEFPLIPLEESFNLEEKESTEERLQQKRVDVSDIVHKLDNHKRVIGEPEDVIMAMEDIDIRYRQKAIEFLHNS